MPSNQGGTCQCIKVDDELPCGHSCLNALSMVECVGNIAQNGGRGDRNPYWNCNHGPDCGNRRIGRRQIARCKPKREGGKGWGLIAVDGVQRGKSYLY